MSSPQILTAKIPYPKAVIFDLDGTLVDSVGDIAEALNAAVAPVAGGSFDPDDVKQMIGGGSLVLIRKALDSRGVTLSEQEWTTTLGRFMHAYSEVSALGRGLYPGALDLLDGLRARGVKLALCTNKPAPVTKIAVDALKLTPFLDVVIGAREDVAKKPDPAMIRACLDPLGISSNHAVMVGDSAADHGAGRAAGTSVVLVDFGYSKVPVHTLKPDVVVSRLLDIPAHFMQPPHL
jgi:phosphoglycolate phosphatase